MLRLVSCQRATSLIEQRTELLLSTVERNSLWLHLCYCPHCSRYARQSALINDLAKVAVGRRADAPDLSAEARQRLQKQLTAATPPQK